MHIHRDVVMKQELLKSPFEQMRDAGMQNVKGLTAEFFETDALITYRCTVCGRERVERV